jgi:release factor glutamine methyltransferase
LPERVVAGPSVRDAVGLGAARLSAAGCETPRLDAELLLGCVLGVGRSRLVIDAFNELDAGELERFESLIGRREQREPVAYITGDRPFRRLVLEVDGRVLIPRPETELLVELGLSLAPGSAVVDVGTGSGAVALALKDERFDLTVVGVDLSFDALEVARANGARLGLDVSFVQGDLLSGLEPRRFDAVLANLPYVRTGEAASLAPEITRYEPSGALYGGADGLDLVRRLVAMLADVGFVALELGPDQAGPVSAQLEDVGFSEISRLRDLAGHERVVVGQR